MALERGLEGRDQLLKLGKRHARETQELQRAGLQLGESYTSHGSCLLSRSCDVRGASYQKESGINSTVPDAIIPAKATSPIGHGPGRASTSNGCAVQHAAGSARNGRAP